MIQDVRDGIKLNNVYRMYAKRIESSHPVKLRPSLHVHLANALSHCPGWTAYLIQDDKTMHQVFMERWIVTSESSACVESASFDYESMDTMLQVDHCIVSPLLTARTIDSITCISLDKLSP